MAGHNVTDNVENLGIAQPAYDAAAVTPSNVADLTNLSRWLFVGSGGNMTVVMKNAQAVLFTGITDGTLLPIRCPDVKATNTTASNIVNLW